MKISNPLEICNLALLRINQRSISSLTDDSPQAKNCNMVYEQAKTYLLSQYTWTFATRNAELRKVSDNSGLKETDRDYDKELGGYLRKFGVPEGFLRLICITNGNNMPIHGNGIRAPFVLEGKYIITDLEKCKMKYVNDIDVVNEFSPQFIECLALDIAIRLSKMFNDSSSYLQQLQMEFSDVFLKAKISDAGQTMMHSVKPSPLFNSYMEF